MNEIEHEELFTKSNVPKEGINYTLEQIAEVHSKEAGWVIGEPRIIPEENGKTVTIQVPLTKYSVEKRGYNR